MATIFNDIPLTRREVLNCSFSAWYDKYHAHVPKACVIRPLPVSFIKYLSSDGIVLPAETRSGQEIGDGDGEYSDWSSEDEEGEPTRNTSSEVFEQFEEVHRAIVSALEKYGPVAPKLNWSAPRDATWILPSNTMKCVDASEVYLLLNASNYIMHDISRAFDGVDDAEGSDEELVYELVLRQWLNINPALEFRCFVKDGEIVGVSQRDPNFYNYLEALSPLFRKLIEIFFEDVLAQTFPEKNYVFDVYIPRPLTKVWLIDINPFSRRTDPLLFTWHELSEIRPDGDADWELRLIARTDKSRFASKEHSENQVPQDVVDAGVDTQKMIELAREWRALQLKEVERSSG